VVPAELNITMKKVDAATASSRLEEILLWKWQSETLKLRADERRKKLRIQLQVS
jgi:hypothetical protein